MSIVGREAKCRSASLEDVCDEEDKEEEQDKQMQVCLVGVAIDGDEVDDVDLSVDRRRDALSVVGRDCHSCRWEAV